MCVCVCVCVKETDRGREECRLTGRNREPPYRRIELLSIIDHQIAAEQKLHLAPATTN